MTSNPNSENPAGTSPPPAGANDAVATSASTGADTFTHATLGRRGKRVCRLGLSATYRPGGGAIARALDAGVNLFFAYGFDTQMTRALRELPAARREEWAIVTGAYNLAFNRRPNLRRVLEKRLRQLGTDYLDAFLFLGVLKPEHLSPWTLEAMQRLREEGLVRQIGISCHDRRLLGELAQGGALDLLMLRYNAAHRGAEQEIFPHLATHDPAVISYTATRWRKLLQRPRGWPEEGRVPTAALCYRFVLSHPAVDVCLMAPSNARHLDENLSALEQGPLDPEELAFMREFGDAVHRQKGWFMGGR